MALHNYDNATQNKQHLRCLPPAVVHADTYVPSGSYELTSEGRFQAHCDHANWELCAVLHDHCDAALPLFLWNNYSEEIRTCRVDTKAYS